MNNDLRGALLLGFGYAKEALANHEEKYRRHPAIEAKRLSIQGDVAIIKAALAAQLRAEAQGTEKRDCIMLPTKLLHTEWPPNNGVMPGNSHADALLQAIQEDGYIKEPLTINCKWMVIDGAHRLYIARLLNITWVPVCIWTGTEWVPKSPITSPAAPAPETGGEKI